MAQTLYYNIDTKQLVIGDCMENQLECVYVAPTINDGTFQIQNNYLYFWDAVTQTYIPIKNELGRPASIQGPQGDSISKIEKVSGNGAAGTSDTYEVYVGKEIVGSFEVFNGKNGAAPQFDIRNGNLYATAQNGDNPVLIGRVVGDKGLTIVGTINSINDLLAITGTHNDAYVLKNNDTNQDTGLAVPAGTLFIYDQQNHNWYQSYCIKGETGPQGEQGIQGLQGLPGVEGENGKDGTTIKGSVDSIADLQFIQSPVYNDAYILSTDDENSDTGEITPAGTLFVYQGDGVFPVWKAVGNILGPKGEQGIQGPVGEKGQRGSQLIPVTGTDALIENAPDTLIDKLDVLHGDFIISSDTGTVWTLDENDSFTSTGVSLKGEKGDKGDQGEKGDKGDQGPQGTSIIIKGSFSSEEALQQITGALGDAYLVDGDLFVWNGLTWENVGSIKGDKGDQGDSYFTEEEAKNLLSFSKTYPETTASLKSLTQYIEDYKKTSSEYVDILQSRIEILENKLSDASKILETLSGIDLDKVKELYPKHA